MKRKFVVDIRKELYFSRMKWIHSTSGKVVILLTLVFAFTTIDKINKINTGEKTCNCAYDGFGYYMYLPHLFNKGHLNIEHEWAQDLQNKYCHGTYAYQLKEHWTGNNIDIYHMGTALIMLPSYTVADVIARAGDYETDGFSYPYMIVYQLNALLFIFLGLLYLRKLLRFFTDELRVSLILILVALGANTYFTFNYQYDLPHLYLFTLNAASLYHLFTYRETDNKRSLWFSAILFGLTVCVRPTQLIFGAIPFFLLLKKHGKSLLLVKQLALFGIFAFLWNIPQILYWKIIGGEFLILNLHTEDIVLTDPNLFDFLFSYRKGWLLYSPLFIILPLGWYFMYKRDKTVLYGTLSFAFFYIWVMSSWECWWYAGSFGQRPMVDVYPILAIPLAFLVDSIKKPVVVAASGLFAVGCIALNLIQSEQTALGILDGYRNSKEHYWHVFGELNPENVHRRYLLIDRSNLFWPEHLSSFDDNPFEIKTRTFRKLEKPLISEPGNNIDLGKIHVLNTFGTDETRIEVPLLYSTSDSTQSALIRMECVSKWNCYSWDNIELSLGHRQGIDIRDTLRFNLPDIRHNADSMQMYIWNQEGSTIELKEFKLIATSLFRK